VSALPDLQVVQDAPVRLVKSGWRLHHRDRPPEFYFRGPSLFMPESPSTIGLLYLAESPQVAIGQLVAGLTFVSMDAVKRRVLTKLEFPRTLRLFDATSPKVAEFGFAREIALSTDYTFSQSWASVIHRAGFDGIAFLSPSTDGGLLFAIFGKTGAGHHTQAISEVSVSASLLQELGVTALYRPSSENLDLE
jgi:hypothetical protein